MIERTSSFIIGLSFQDAGIAVCVVEDSKDEKPLRIIGIEQSKTVSLNQLYEMVKRFLPPQDRSEYWLEIASSDRSVAKEMAQRLKTNRKRTSVQWEPKGSEGTKPQHYLAHALSAINDGWIVKSEDVDLSSVQDSLKTLEFGSDGLLVKGLPVAEALLYAIGQTCLRICAGDYVPRSQSQSLGVHVGKPSELHQTLERFTHSHDPFHPSNLPQGRY